MSSKLNIFVVFGAGLVVAAVIFVAMLSSSVDLGSLFEKKSKTDLDAFSTDGGFPRVSSADHVRGGADASIVWIEYGDFECPFCKKYFPELEQLLAEYPNDVQVVFRHYPLEIHELAFEKAVASECAAELGGETAFWKYHDLLYDRSDANGQGIEFTDLPALAVEIGLNRNAFSSCLSSGRHDARINGDLATGTAAAIEGTPTTVIVAPDGSGTVVPGPIQIEEMREIMDYLLTTYETTP